MTRPDGPTPGSAADDVPAADRDSVARAILLRQLTVGPRTEAQLREALSRRNVPAEVAEPLLARFVEVGLIDDRAYAEALIRSETMAGGLSRRRVQHRLREKGVPDQVVANAIEGIDPAAEERAAFELARRRAGRMSGLDPVTRRRRLSGVLARRGYDAATVRKVVDDVLADAASGNRSAYGHSGEG